MDASDEVTVDLVKNRYELEDRLFRGYGYAYSVVNNLTSPLQEIRSIFDNLPQESREDFAKIARRCGNIPGALEGYMQSLKYGKEHGFVAPRRQVGIGIAQSAELAQAGTYFDELARKAAAAGVDMQGNADLAKQAYGRLEKFMQTELYPVAPLADACGIEQYPDYAEYFVGARINPREIFEWGTAELLSIIAEQYKIAREVGIAGAGGAGGTGGADPYAAIEQAMHLFDTDKKLQIHGVAALQAWMAATSGEAIEFLADDYFFMPPVLKKLECMIAPTHDGGIYYTGPSDDFKRPGRMWWSVPPGVETFSTWKERTTVYHEGVPGHHTQVATATYNQNNLNEFRKDFWLSGYGEGWALYAERLMDEFGFLKTPHDKMGMLDGQRLRAARIVIDIGLHCGFEVPRELQGKFGTGVIDYNKGYQILDANYSANQGFKQFEMDRYAGWPGQAISYKVGQKRWFEIREAARRSGKFNAADGSFDLKKFHTVALNLGPMTLDLLEDAVLRQG
jgi:uncharacterized protein (DUF885 family)